ARSTGARRCCSRACTISITRVSSARSPWRSARPRRPTRHRDERRDLAAAGDRGLGAGQRVRRRGRTARRGVRVDAGGVGARCRCAARVSPRAGIPIYLATLSPRSLEMTGEVADGWLGTSFMPEHAHVFLDHLATGAKRAGRALDALDLHVSAGALAFGDDVEKLIPPRKPGLAFS